MKRILINATHNEEIRVALCKGNQMYDFDLENCTREQKKSNIYKAHVTRVEPSLEAVFVEYGANRQGFLPIREIAKEYLAGNPRTENVRNLIKEGDTLIVQVEKEERGNKGAALSTFVSLAGRYLVLMPNNPRGGGISRQISGKNREEMKRIVSNLQMPKGMSVIIRTAGIGKSEEDLQHDLSHLLSIWESIGEQNKEHKSPRLVHQEAGVVTRALRDYMRDDISEIWIDSANAYDEAVYFIKSVMPKQLDKVRKYTDLEPMLTRFGIEKQVETTYQREVRLPAGGSIVIDQTEAMVAIDINSAKSTKGSDVAATAYHTNLEAAEEIARQLRLRDMGGLVVIDFIDMYDTSHQKEVAKRLIDSTKFDRARVQFGEISKFGLMEMSRQRLRPSLEESTAYQCPRCHGTGMIRDIRSLSLAIVRQIEQLALTHRQGEIQAEVPTDIAAFILNEKRDTLVYLEQDSGARITILPHAHLESPKYNIHYKPDGFAPSSYERINNSEDKHANDLGYEVDWQMADNDSPEHQPTRQPKKGKDSQNEQYSQDSKDNNAKTDSKVNNDNLTTPVTDKVQPHRNERNNQQNNQQTATRSQQVSPQNPQQSNQSQARPQTEQPKAVAWLSNLFAPTPQAQTVEAVSSQEAAQAIESIINNGGQSLGSFGQADMSALTPSQQESQSQSLQTPTTDKRNETVNVSGDSSNNNDNQNKRRMPKNEKGRDKTERRNHNRNGKKYNKPDSENGNEKNESHEQSSGNERDERNNRTQKPDLKADTKLEKKSDKSKRNPSSRRDSRGEFPRGETLQLNEQQVQVTEKEQGQHQEAQSQESSEATNKRQGRNDRNDRSRNDRSQKSQERQQNHSQDRVQKPTNPNEVNLQVSRNDRDNGKGQKPETVHLSLDNSKPTAQPAVNSPVKSERQEPKQQPKAQHKQPQPQASIKPQSPVKSVKVEQAETAKIAEQTVVTTQVPQEPKAPQPPMPVVAKVEPVKTEAKTEVKVEMPAVVNAPVRADGRASNDPRVVLDELAKKLVEQLTNKQPALTKATDSNIDSNKSVVNQKPVSILGSVGEFLRATLHNAEERIQTEGVIACFIDAVTKVKQSKMTAESVVESTPESKSNESTVSNADIEAELNKFDFSNYGYQTLSADYLGEFHSLTKSADQFDIAQGKTETAPTPIGKRASNDPRGQYSGFDEVTFDAVTEKTVLDNAVLDNTKTKDAPKKSQVDLFEQVIETPPIDVTEAVSEAPIATSELTTESAPTLTEVYTETAEFIVVDESVESEVEATKTTATYETNDDFANAFGRLLDEDVTETAEIEEVAESDKTSKQQQSQEERGKTTFDKYKSMLANVSDQLSAGQKGTNLFLKTPVVPKARSRKKD